MSCFTVSYSSDHRTTGPEGNGKAEKLQEGLPRKRIPALKCMDRRLCGQINNRCLEN
jgi:hypothetical protein